jgi:Fe-S-cluster containining protein
MAEPGVTGDQTPPLPLPAGGFSDWLAGMRRALEGAGPGSDVPCDGCTACCTSSQFVHIAPDETATLAHIPAGLLFPAPRMPRGHVLLGYDENGHCPMLVDGGCSIYEHRPRTCRTYDCRVFSATGVELEDEDKSAIARRARRWRFDFPDEADQVEHAAVRAAAAFVRERADLLPEGAAPANATQHAVLAVRLHDAFLGRDAETGAVRVRLSSGPGGRGRAH